MSTTQTNPIHRNSRAPDYRRGFFFTVLALVILSFIFISISLWAQAQTANEARAAERFRVEALQTALGMVSNDTLTKFANASAIFAINKLATSLEEYTDTYDTCSIQGMTYYTGPHNEYPDGAYLMNSSIYELMFYGNTSAYLHGHAAGDHWNSSGNLTYVGDERKYTIDNFFNQTRAAVAVLGYNVTWGKPDNFTFNQTDAWTMNVSMVIPMNFTDSRGWVNISRRVVINFSIPIDGFTDPSVMRGDMVHRPNPTTSTCGSSCISDFANRPHRNVYRGVNAYTSNVVYNNSTDAQAKLLANGNEGMGWFFGPVSDQPISAFSDTNVKYNRSNIRSYIYITSSAADALEQSGNFGGLIITTPLGAENKTAYTVGNCKYTNHTQTNCIFCAFYQETNDSKNCPLTAKAQVTPESIPKDPYIPYIQLNNYDPTVNVPHNYHTDLPEVLIQSDLNATDLCPNLNATNLVCLDPVQSNPSIANIKLMNSHAKVWDITGPRDMALCGFYVRSDYGPSYTQRFLDFWGVQNPNKNYSKLNQGIESFVMGQWAGGKTDACAQVLNSKIETYSRVDYQFYSTDLNGVGFTCNGPFVEGMPGCKQFGHCTSTGPLMNGTGRFALCVDNTKPLINPSPALRYNVTNLTFNPPSPLPPSFNPVCR